jgi:hypothetical protein
MRTATAERMRILLGSEDLDQARRMKLMRLVGLGVTCDRWGVHQREVGQLKIIEEQLGGRGSWSRTMMLAHHPNRIHLRRRLLKKGEDPNSAHHVKRRAIAIKHR